MDKIALKSKTRKELNKKAKALRKEKKIPCVLYGPEIKESLSLVVDYKEFKKVYDEAGESTIIELNIDDKNKKNVLVRDVQLNPLTSDFDHIDFYQINMKEKITAYVELNYVGKSKAVKDLAGILVKNMNEIEVKCLPADLPKEINVDISKLNTFDDFIKIKDLDIPEKVEIDYNLEDIVATVTPPRSEEELDALDEEVEEKVDEVEGVKKEEAEEGEGEEGEKKEEGEVGEKKEEAGNGSEGQEKK